MKLPKELRVVTAYDHPNDRTTLLILRGNELIGCNFLQGDDEEPTTTDQGVTDHVIAAVGSNIEVDGWMDGMHEAMWDYITEDEMWQSEMHGY